MTEPTREVSVLDRMHDITYDGRPINRHHLKRALVHAGIDPDMDLSVLHERLSGWHELWTLLVNLVQAIDTASPIAVSVESDRRVLDDAITAARNRIEEPRD